MQTFTRQHIARAAGLSLRQYERRVAHGIFPPAGGSKRVPLYGPEHLRVALRLRELESAPRTLEEIRRELRRPHIVKRPSPSRRDP